MLLMEAKGRAAYIDGARVLHRAASPLLAHEGGDAKGRQWCCLEELCVLGVPCSLLWLQPVQASIDIVRNRSGGPGQDAGIRDQQQQGNSAGFSRCML